ncbi:MAG: DUF3823 domain-containing protein [Sphingobacteriaceae bacterium]|nr:MAG: DUF3823 domain-containing protein [Sphingobacteriaceae bacterium]
MKVKIYIKAQVLAMLLLPVLFLAACTKDNYDAPKSILSGRVIYQNQAVGVRSNAVQLQLWQHGYVFFTPIPVYIDQNGAYSALLFNGDYKLTRISGGPWMPQTDSVNVHVSGNTVVDVPVNPYFVVSSATYQRSGTTITSTVTVQKANATSQVDAVRLYVSRTILVDENNTDASTTIAGTTVTPGQPLTATITIPPSLTSADAVYVRTGVKTVGVNELAYSAPTKIQLK